MSHEVVLVDTYLFMLDEARGLLSDKSHGLKVAMASPLDRRAGGAATVAAIGEIVR